MAAYSHGMPVGTPAPAFSLPATDGKTYSLSDFGSAKALVVVFTCNHCPYAVASEERFVRISRDYGPRGVQLVAINSNDATKYPDDGFDAMVARAEQRGFDFPYLHDKSQAIARAYDAACTPDIFVFGPDRKLVYNGRLDDNWKDESKITRHDLREVLDAVLADRAPSLPEVVPSMGCSIKWKQ